MNFPTFDQETDITFEYEFSDFSLAKEENIREWLLNVAKQESGTIGHLNYIFCSDDFLQKINWRYLKHKSLTDIITFQYESSPIEADIYISVDRVTENAVIHNNSFYEECYRVIVHGLLHCLGYKDKTDTEKRIMREKEDKALSLVKD